MDYKVLLLWILTACIEVAPSSDFCMVNPNFNYLTNQELHDLKKINNLLRIITLSKYFRPLSPTHVDQVGVRIRKI